MNPHTKQNLHNWLIHPVKKESWTETLFTGLVMLAAVAVAILILALAMQGAQ